MLKPRPRLFGGGAGEWLEGKTDGEDGSIFLQNKNLKDGVYTGSSVC